MNKSPPSKKTLRAQEPFYFVFDVCVFQLTGLYDLKNKQISQAHNHLMKRKTG